MIGADEDDVIRNQRIAMKAYLFAILANVITPAHLAGSFIEGVENAGARADEDRILHDRGDREDSTTSFVLPDELRRSRFVLLDSFRLGATETYQR